MEPTMKQPDRPSAFPRGRASHVLVLVSALTFLCALPAAAGDIPLVRVEEPGNPPDATGLGSVAASFWIGRTEVTNGEYAAFLNAVASSDPNGLYNPAMAISRSGDPGSHSYSTTQPDRPVTHASWYDALRFANWLHNGQPTGPQAASTTEDGAYTFAGPEDVGPRNAGARYFLPSEDEWYKAAYFEGGAVPRYWLYPTRSDDAPSAGAPSGADNLANYDGAAGGVSPVGSYPASASPHGTLDQAGNVWEWTETEVEGLRGIRGGSWDDYATLLDAWYRDADDPASEHEFLGFRIASSVGQVGSTFRRGDVNQDVAMDISDAVAIFGYLFLGAARPGCVSAADSNDDGSVDISDGVSVLNHLFLGGASIPAPFPGCGTDPTPDDLDCLAFPECP